MRGGGNVATRRRARLRASSARRGIEASLELLVSLATVVASTPTALGAYVAGVVDGSLATDVGSTRELFPLPIAGETPFDSWVPE